MRAGSRGASGNDTDTGVSLFILPLTLSFMDLKYSGAFVSTVATFAAILEGHFIRMGRA